MKNCPVCLSDRGRPSYEKPWARLWQCAACGCFYDERKNTEETNRGHFQVHEPEINRAFAEFCAASRINYVKENLPAGRLLEFGFGGGEFLACAARHGYSVTGVDLFSKPWPENLVPGVQVVRQDSLSFKAEEPFDAAAAFHLLEHFPDPYPFLETVRLNLRQGGLFVFEVPNAGALLQKVLREKWGFYDYHYIHYTLKGIRALMARAGFRVLELKSVGSSLESLISHAVHFSTRKLTSSCPGESFRLPYPVSFCLSVMEGKLGFGLNTVCVAVKA